MLLNFECDVHTKHLYSILVEFFLFEFDPLKQVLELETKLLLMLQQLNVDLSYKHRILPSRIYMC